jgi:hypothetical protein
MRELREKLLRIFAHDGHGFSRNRNFHAFDDREVRRAARDGKLLQSLTADLLARELTQISVAVIDTPSGHQRFVVELAWDGGRRVSYLTQTEMDLLGENERVSKVLAGVTHGIHWGRAGRAPARRKRSLGL